MMRASGVRIGTHRPYRAGRVNILGWREGWEEEEKGRELQSCWKEDPGKRAGSTTRALFLPCTVGTCFDGRDGISDWHWPDRSVAPRFAPFVKHCVSIPPRLSALGFGHWMVMTAYPVALLQICIYIYILVRYFRTSRSSGSWVTLSLRSMQATTRPLEDVWVRGSPMDSSSWIPLKQCKAGNFSAGTTFA